MSRLVLVQPDGCEVSKLLQKAVSDAAEFEAATARLLSLSAEHKKKAKCIRDTLQRALDAHTIDSQSKWQVFLAQAKEEVRSEVDFLKFSNSQQRETIQRLEFADTQQREIIQRLEVEVKRLTELTQSQKSELDVVTERNAALSERVDELSERLQQSLQEDVRSSALRRQIAINIEFEVKKELWSALGEDDMTAKEILHSDLFQLRREFRRAGRPVPEKLAGWLDVESRAGWRKFSSAMEYMKAFSKQGAHPTKLNGEEVTVAHAKELVDEPFEYESDRTDDLRPWDEALKDTVKRYIDVLAELYREPGEKLLYA